VPQPAIWIHAAGVRGQGLRSATTTTAMSTEAMAKRMVSTHSGWPIRESTRLGTKAEDQRKM